MKKEEISEILNWIKNNRLLITHNEAKVLVDLWYISYQAFKDNNKKYDVIDILVDEQKMNYAITEKGKKFLEDNK